MSGDGINIRPDELDKGGDSLDQFASKLDSNTSKVDEAHRGLSAHARSDRSGLGQVLVKFADKTGTAFSDIGKQLSRVIKGSSQRLKAGGKRHRENEQEVTDSLTKIHPKGTETKAHSGGGGQSTTTSSAGAGTTTAKPPKPHGGDGGGAPKEPTTPSGSGGAGGEGGGGGGDKGPELPEDPASKASPKLSGHQPPSSNGQYSDTFKNNPTLPQSSKYDKPLPDSNGYIPEDKSRGSKVAQLTDPPDKLTKKDGLITHVNDEPIGDYMARMSRDRAEKAADPQAKWKADHPGQPVPGKIKAAGKEGTCSALAIDRRTGLITQGVNGKGARAAIPPDKLHPLLQQNLQDMRAYQHPVVDKDGNLVPNTRIANPYDGQVHYSVPASHAEVKAVNELLWQRQAGHDGPLPASTLNEITYDPRWTNQIGDAGVGDPAAACGNCNSILRGAHSNTGNCEYDPDDHRYVNPN